MITTSFIYSPIFGSVDDNYKPIIPIRIKLFTIFIFVC